jgi:hypothetical protein
MLRELLKGPFYNRGFLCRKFGERLPFLSCKIDPFRMTEKNVYYYETSYLLTFRKKFDKDFLQELVGTLMYP